MVAQFYAYLSGRMFNDPVGMAIYAELHYMMSSLMPVSYTHLDVYKRQDIWRERASTLSVEISQRFH